MCLENEKLNGTSTAHAAGCATCHYGEDSAPRLPWAPEQRAGCVPPQAEGKTRALREPQQVHGVNLQRDLGRGCRQKMRCPLPAAEVRGIHCLASYPCASAHAQAFAVYLRGAHSAHTVLLLLPGKE